MLACSQLGGQSYSNDSSKVQYRTLLVCSLNCAGTVIWRAGMREQTYSKVHGTIKETNKLGKGQCCCKHCLNTQCDVVES